jgi:hypothetical protein
LYEDALNEADQDIMNFNNARRPEASIPLSFKEKSHNKPGFLTSERKNFSTKTNALLEFVENNKMNEALMYGATQEDLEKEVQGEFGKEILEVCKEHNITGSAIFDAFDIMKSIIGDDPDVNAAIASWGGDSSESEEEAEGEDEDEEIEESFKSLDEMTRAIRKRIAEKRLRERMNQKKRNR